ncbi:lipopolysaccharide biosynthesis protein [Kitasatospora sp. McL0602]|uniref:lipopolysaccharide biosynthesis protein n=1 Tax=Kitasatospora sp. McL0602 TaxID=3439530 RepID=UPI003F8BDC47
MNPLARLSNALPPGTKIVAVGTVVLGAASYVHLAVAGHSLSTADMAGVSVLWTIVMSVGMGLFFPLEQELTRIVAARAVHQEGAAPVLRRAALLTGGFLAAVVGLLAVFERPLADTFFHGDAQLVWALAGSFVGLALTFMTRGVLAGLGRFHAYGAQLAIDGGLRIVLALALGALGPHSALAFSLILAVSPLIAFALTLPVTVRASLPGPPISWPDLLRGFGPLIGSTLLAQMMVNAVVLSTQLLAPTEVALVAALLNALVLARVPLFVFAALQASLLSGLASVAATGDHGGFLRMLRKACLVVTVLSLCGAVPAVLIGPWLIRLLFAAPDVLTRFDFLWLSAGTLCYLLAQVLGQALIVLHRHRVQLASWLFGSAVLCGVTMLPGSIATRVTIAFAAGTAATALAMAWSLSRWGAPRPATGSARPATERVRTP